MREPVRGGGEPVTLQLARRYSRHHGRHKVHVVSPRPVPRSRLSPATTRRASRNRSVWLGQQVGSHEGLSPYSIRLPRGVELPSRPACPEERTGRSPPRARALAQSRPRAGAGSAVPHRRPVREWARRNGATPAQIAARLASSPEAVDRSDRGNEHARRLGNLELTRIRHLRLTGDQSRVGHFIRISGVAHDSVRTSGRRFITISP